MTSADDRCTDDAPSFETAGGRVVVGVRGEVDDPSAAELSAVLDLVIDRGNQVVVVDLSRCSFMGTSGYRAIASGAERLRLLGGALTVQSPSATFRRLIEFLVAPGMILLEGPETANDHGRPAKSGTQASIFVGFELGPYLARVQGTASDDGVVDGILRLVAGLARVSVGGADGVSVSLRRHGRLATVAASDQTVSDMDTEQYAVGEGPCVGASVEGRRFHASRLASETRWPAFIPKARELGINAILSSPLFSADEPVGALNIYSCAAAAFGPKAQQVAAAFATEASTVLTLTGVSTAADHRAGQVAEALRDPGVHSPGPGRVDES